MDATPDPIRPAREPVVNLPGVVTLTLVALLAVQALRAWVLSDEADTSLFLDLAFVPGRLVAALDPSRGPDVLREALSGGGGPAALAARAAFARYILAEPEAAPWTLAGYALLHGSWSHVILNGVWLAAFGAPVARRLGAARFLALALASVVAGALAHLALDPLSVAPVIGASAGVSGIMAAAARFVFRPAEPIAGSIAGPALPPWQRLAPPPLQTLPELLRNRPAATFLAIWVVTNVAFGLLAVPLGMSEGAVAWDAHLGGFLAGFLLLPLIDRRR